MCKLPNQTFWHAQGLNNKCKALKVSFEEHVFSDYEWTASCIQLFVKYLFPFVHNTYSGIGTSIYLCLKEALSYHINKYSPTPQSNKQKKTPPQIINYIPTWKISKTSWFQWNHILETGANNDKNNFINHVQFHKPVNSSSPIPLTTAPSGSPITNLIRHACSLWHWQ